MARKKWYIGTICGVLILKSENTGAKRDNDRKSLIRIKANLSYVLRLMTTVTILNALMNPKSASKRIIILF